MNTLIDLFKRHRVASLLIAVLLFLAFTNPTLDEFRDFEGLIPEVKFLARRANYFVVFSTFEYAPGEVGYSTPLANDEQKRYVGVMHNFIRVK